MRMQHARTLAQRLGIAASVMCVAGSLIVSALTPTVVHARVPQVANTGAVDELALIRQTEVLEARGDLAGAERLARDVLARSPTSLSSLIVLERLLTMQGKLTQIEPFVDRLLAIDRLSVIGHQMRVRMYATVNRPEDLRLAGDAWIAAMPDVETPYSEVARVYRSRGDLVRATAVLDQGRKRLGGDALALELGDALAEAHDYDRAVVEWSAGIGRDGQGFLPIQRRLQALPDGGVAAIPKLVMLLRRDPSTTNRRRSASQIALDAGLVVEAEQLARQVYRELPTEERANYLTDVGRRADAGHMTKLAYWAYGEAMRIDTDTARRMALHARYAQIALEAGDTARAAKIYSDLEKAAAPGSAQRRQALAARIQLGASRGDVERALDELMVLREEYPRAPEIDEAASRVGTAMLDRGNLDGALKAVLGVRGARSGATRGRIFLRQGKVEAARDELINAAPQLTGAEATATLTLATVILRLSEAGGELIGRALAIVADDAAGAVRLLAEDSRALQPPERAVLLDYAATIADRSGLAQQAEHARREIVAQYPQSSVAPAALLSLAQSVMSRGSTAEARTLLETLILDYPRSALLPQARRELDRVMGRVPGR